MREIPQLEKRPGCTLVLSGGATKAFYFHLGVLKVLRPSEVTAIVGTSAGSVLGAFIASGASVDTLLTSLYQKKVYIPKFDSWVRTLTSSMLFRPKYKDITKQSLYTSWVGLQFLLTLPRVFWHQDIVAEALDRLVNSQLHATAFFDSSALEDLFQSLLPTSDFANLDHELYVVATGLDSQKRGVFNGRYDFEDEANVFLTDVPIHKAVRASSAIPGMFEPVKIKGEYYIDGEVKQTLSADIGVRLTDQVVISHTYQPLALQGKGSVRNMGWLNVLKQSTSIVFHERIAVWRHIYEQQHPEKEIIWIEPTPDDLDFFLAPEFSFRPEVQKKMIKSGENAARRALMEQVRT